MFSGSEPDVLPLNDTAIHTAASPEGFEPPTFGLGNRHSIRLNYEDISLRLATYSEQLPVSRLPGLDQAGLREDVHSVLSFVFVAGTWVDDDVSIVGKLPDDSDPVLEILGTDDGWFSPPEHRGELFGCLGSVDRIEFESVTIEAKTAKSCDDAVLVCALFLRRAAERTHALFGDFLSEAADGIHHRRCPA